MLSDALLSELPLVAILRGVTPERIEAIADLLVGEGFRAIEVPLNSPEPFKSIEMLARRFGARCLTGAGTVTTPSDVDRVADAGGTLIVSPHTDVAVVARTVEKKLFPMPGVLTPSECYAAIGAGARRGERPAGRTSGGKAVKPGPAGQKEGAFAPASCRTRYAPSVMLPPGHASPWQSSIAAARACCGVLPCSTSVQT